MDLVSSVDRNFLKEVVETKFVGIMRMPVWEGVKFGENCAQIRVNLRFFVRALENGGFRIVFLARLLEKNGRFQGSQMQRE